MAVEVEFDDAEVRKFIQGVTEKLSDVRNVKPRFMALLSSIVYRDVMDHFEQEKGPDGKWKPWSKIYREHMRKIGKGGNKTLQDTGRLRQSFLPKNHRATKDGILWFNNAKTGGFPYALAHDEGELGMPQREFMWLSDEAQDKISEQTLQFMLDEGY